MKILLLTQVLPYPPDSGPKIKTWNVLKYLARRHEVILASFVRGDQSTAVSRLRQMCAAVHPVPITRGRPRDVWDLGRSLIRCQPFVITRDDRSAMRRLVDRLAAEHPIDLVHADQLNTAQYALRVAKVARVLDTHNALWLVTQRLCRSLPPGPAKLLAAREWRQLRRYEGHVCQRFDAVTAVSEPDRNALLQATETPLPMRVVPIAIDPDEMAMLPRRPDGDRILHLGTLLWPPNVDGLLWFLREVLPRIHAQRPQVVVDVAGGSPPAAVRSAAQRDSRIRLAGYVADLSALLERATALVVPLRVGAGMRVRILEGLARGVPMVSTSIGGEGIDAHHEQQLLVADTAEAFANATLRLLADAALAQRLARAGRQLIEERYDYRSVCRDLDQVYADARRHSRVRQCPTDTPPGGARSEL